MLDKVYVTAIHPCLVRCAPLWPYLRIHLLHLLGSVDPFLLLKLLSLLHQPGLKCQLIILPPLLVFLVFLLLDLTWETRVNRRKYNACV